MGSGIYFFLVGVVGVTKAFTKSSNEPLMVNFSSYLDARFLTAFFGLTAFAMY